MRLFACTMLAVGLLASCASPPHRDSRAEREALMETSRAWARTAASGNLEATLAYWADDAIVLAPDQPAVVGKAAIRDFLKQTQTIPRFSITWEPERATIATTGDMGYLIERNRVSFADSAGGLRTQYGKAVSIWRKDATGVWKCVVDTWNNNPSERVLPR